MFEVRESLQKVKNILFSLENSLKDVLFLVKEHNLMTKLYQKYKVSNIVEKFLHWLVTDWARPNSLLTPRTRQNGTGS